MTTQKYLIYLIGKPGVGKYTIAKVLAKYGYIVCDNQLINNPVFSIVGYDGFGDVSEDSWDAIEKIRSIVFDVLVAQKQNNYVLTNVLNDDEDDRNLFNQVQNMSKEHGSVFVPVTLFVDRDEHLKRIVNPARRQHYKSVDPKDVDSGSKSLPITHKNLLELDITHLSAEDSVKNILEHCRGLQGT